VSLLLALVLAQDVTAVRAGKLYTGEGAPLENAWIVIRGGKIVEVRAGGDAPPGAKVVDASAKVVIPGLVDAHTALADAGRDGDESVAPDVRAIDGFDFFDRLRPQLAGGVTTAYVSPGSRRLVSGQGAVVKTAGRGPKERTLAAVWGTHVTLGEDSKNPPELFKPPVPPTPDNPIRPARRQYPASRMGQFAVLREKAPQGPWVVEASESDDLVKAALLAEELGRRIVFLDAEGAPEIAEFLAARKIPVVYNPSYAPGRRAGAEAFPLGGLEGAAALAKAGVVTALHAPRDADLRELLFIAAAAVRGGLSPERALAAVTRVPAEILGVAERVGSLAPGRDADFVVLSGEPFGASTSVERVFIDGEAVFEKREGDVQTYRALRNAGKAGETIAIRAGRVLTDGPGVVSDGLVLIEGGKIAFVGRGRPIPAGAKVLDVPRGAVAPGFIDFGAWMGLDAERTERAARGEPRGTSGGLTAAPSALARLSGPDFDAARAAGVTAALLAPEGTGPCGLLRLTPGKSTVLRDTAALKVAVQGGTAGVAALRESLNRARKYHDEWEAYERAKKEREAKASDPISGRWTGTLEGKTDFTLELKLDGSKASGTFQSAVTAGVAEPLEGAYEKEELKLQRKREGFEVELALKLSGPNVLKGTWRTLASGKESKGALEAKRAVEEAKAPKREDALDPWRKVFRREIPVIAVARDLPAIEAALKALREERELDVVLAGAEEAAWAGDALAGKGAAVALSPELVLRERRGGELNAAEALAAQGVPVAFASGGDSRELPLGAAWAVRHGLDPADALRAMTATPARLLRMESRIGAIERGRDADLVVFDGDPFAPSSRVKYVLIEGKIVVER